MTRGAASARPIRLSARTRLSLLYSSMLTAAMAIVLGLVYVFMRYVPTYALAAAPAATPRVIGRAHPEAAGIGSTATTATPALTLTSSDQVLQTLLVVCAVALGVLAASGTILGWVIAGRALRPIAAINQAVRAASAGSLSHRIASRGPRDEFTELSRNVDEMLSSLQREFEARERFAANASHELKTPLATVKTLVHVTLSRPRLTLDQAIRALEEVQTTNERNIRTVGALLELATVAASPAQEQVDLAELVTTAWEGLARTAVPADIRLQARLDAAWATGDADLLLRLIANVLDNALRYNQPGGWIAVTTGAADGDALLTVENTGPVVTAEMAGRLTEPFVRGAGRTGPSGHGLGLALVASIVRSHGGTLEIEPRAAGGLRVSVRLPPGRAEA